jgi:transcriptional regulator with XRE-family HTH domain
MEGHAEVVRILRLLKTLLAARDIRLVALQRHLGLSAGTIGRIFNGTIELKYHQLIDILDYLQIPPLAFFQIAYEAADSSADALAFRLAKIAPLEEPKVERLSRAELRELVQETLHQLGYAAPKTGSATGPGAASANAAKRRPGRRPRPKKDEPEE